MPIKRKIFLCRLKPANAVSKLFYKNEPVWPIVNIEEEMALNRLIINYNVEIEFIAEERLKYESESTNAGLVIVFDDALYDLASLYAHLTKRNLKVIGNYLELSQIFDFDVIITFFDQITFDLMDIVYANPQKKKSPGFICGKNVQEVRKNVLMKSAILSLNGYIKSNNQRLDFLPLLKDHSIITEKKKVICGNLESAFIRKNLSSNANLLFIDTHSTYLDANFGNLILCPFVNIKLSTNKETPFCLDNNFCNRLGISKDKAVGSGKLISPNELKANVLVFSGCHTASLQTNKVLNNDWGYPIELINNCEIGVYIANWKVIMSNFYEVNQMVDFIDMGKDIGYCVGLYNYNSTINKHGNHFCIFGDPNINLSHRGKTTPLIRNTRPNQKYPEEIRPFVKKIPLLQELFNDLLLKSDHPGYGRFKSNLAHLKSLNTELLFKNNVLDLDNKDARRVIAFFSKYSFFREMHLMNDWLKYLRQFVIYKSAIHCDLCGNQLEKMQCNLHSSGLKREILNCPMCGIIQDSPLDTQLIKLSFSSQQEIIIDTTYIKKENTFIEIGIGKVKNREFKLWRIYPKEKCDSTSVFKFSIPQKHIVKGPTFIGCFIFFNGNFIVRKQLLRGEWLNPSI